MISFNISSKSLSFLFAFELLSSCVSFLSILYPRNNTNEIKPTPTNKRTILLLVAFVILMGLIDTIYPLLNKYAMDTFFVEKPNFDYLWNNYPHTLLEARSLPDETKNVSIAGRIVFMRKMGKLSFLTIGDIEGKIQISIKDNDISNTNESELYNLIDPQIHNALFN